MNISPTRISQRLVTLFQPVVTKPSPLSAREWDSLGVVWTLLILCATTMPWINFTGRAYWQKVVWVPFGDACWSQWFLNDVFNNLLLFLPFGWCLVLAQRSRSQNCLLRVALLAIILSFAVEFFQVFSLRRSPSMTDVCTNTMGAVFAALRALEHHVQEREARGGEKDFITREPLRELSIPITPSSTSEPSTPSHS